MEHLTSTNAAILLFLLMIAVAIGGYFAGVAGYFFADLIKANPRFNSISSKFSAWFNFVVVAILLGYYSNIFLPILLISAHSAWLYQTSKKIRQEKIMLAFKSMLLLRSRDKYDDNSLTI